MSYEEYVKENAVDIGYLSDWYQSSVTDDPPVWTDEHIEELYGDFYLIPKSIIDKEESN